MHTRGEGWCLGDDASGERGGKAEPRLLDALRHGRSRAVQRVRLAASSRVLWERDAGDVLESFVRAALERTAERLRAEERCLGPADDRALRAFEAREAEARDLVEAARDEAARRVFDALRAIEERRFAARKRPDLEDAVRAAQRESARAHAAAALDDALAHALEARMHASKVIEDVARALAWIATAEQGGISLEWDRELESIRRALEAELEPRLLALAPPSQPDPDPDPEPEPAPPAPNRALLGTLTAAIGCRVPVARVLAARGQSDTVEVVLPGSRVAGDLREQLVAIGAAHGWKVIVRASGPDLSSAGRPSANQRAFTAHPLASSAFTTAAVAEAHAALSGSVPARRRVVAPEWNAAGRPWLRCMLCATELAPLDCDFQRVACPCCGEGQLTLIDVPPSPVSWAERAHPEPPPMPAGARWRGAPVARRVICSACYATATVETADLSRETCGRCRCAGTLELD
jgi:hypothetical protein